MIPDEHLLDLSVAGFAIALISERVPYDPVKGAPAAVLVPPVVMVEFEKAAFRRNLVTVYEDTFSINRVFVLCGMQVAVDRTVKAITYVWSDGTKKEIGT